MTPQSGPGGLERVVVSTPLCEGEIFLHGAHVARWTPRGARPVLYLSSKSAFAPGKAIRGGVPVIFPWFGPRSDGKPGPQHGYARTAVWTFVNSSIRPDGAAETAFGLDGSDSGPDAQGAPKVFGVRFVVAMGSALEMALEVRNESAAQVRFEEALHTYLAVGDVRQVSIAGLEGVEYLDKTDPDRPGAFRRKRQGGEPLRIGKETDSVYLNATSACTVTDPLWDRRILVEKTGSLSTVVWNPWAEKAAGMADLGPDEWTGFVCVESANVSENAVVLEPGQVHRMAVTLRTVPVA